MLNKFKQSSFISIAGAIIISASLIGCTKASPISQAPASQTPVPQTQPFVSGIKDQGTTDSCKPSALSASGCTEAKKLTVTFPKKAILGRQFIYNLDLQYSSQYDSSYDLYNQSEVVTSVPATFQIQGDELQLMSIGSIKFPSDVNHPNQLISRFKIVSETDTSLEVTTADSSAYLAEQLGPVNPDSKDLGYLDFWVRSAETAENGALFLQQTSITGMDGSVSEFMESIFPRETLTPGAQFEAFKMNPDDPVGGTDGAVARFRFLPGDTVYTGEDKHAFAQHFDLSPKADGTPATIDWYVTSNAPDSILPYLKLAVEGWNRYFIKMKGIQRNVMSFKGKLPDGIHLGDPRYNVIAWDSRLVAGAAYETQGSDPENGKQSHSMIYMPAAWIQIGTDYWNQGQYSEGSAGDPGSASGAPSAKRTKLSLKSACGRDLRDGVALMASGRLDADEVARFGHQLLKQTLFHEVGHSLGFAHNFEGSTEMDLSKPGTLFSSSIMDYNDFEIERAAFSDENSSDGPLLEYDRQTLSAIYNHSKDIADNDRVMPACNDAEADNEAGGVNPICIRYDVEHDPTLSVQRAWNRITQSTLPGDVTLEQAIGRIPSLYLTDEATTTVKTNDDLQKLVNGFAGALTGSLNYYLGNSRASLGYTVRLNLKSLLMFGVTLPSDYDAAAMRERAFAGASDMVGLLSLPANVTTALNSAIQAGLARIATCPYMIRMADSTKTKLVQSLTKQVSVAVNRFTTDTAKGIPAMRAKILAALARHPAVPYYLGKDDDGKETNYENAVIGILGDAVTGQGKYTAPERIAAAKALATYAGRLAFENNAPTLLKELTDERNAAMDNASYEVAQSVLEALGEN